MYTYRKKHVKLLSVDGRITSEKLKKWVGTFFIVFRYFDPVIPCPVFCLKNIFLYTEKALFK